MLKVWRRGGYSLLGTLDIILLILFFLPLTFTVKAKGEYVEIWSCGRKVYVFPLTSDTVLNVKGYIGISTVEIKDGKVRMLSSPCPLKICVKTGWIGERGGEIICVPNKVVIRIKGVNNVDAITR